MTTPLDLPIERHPWPPFIPQSPRVLILGTFPPPQARWSMEFYYPNRINDFWRIIGLLFFNDVNHFWNNGSKAFELDKIKDFLNEHGIALSDTGAEVRRLKGNASDKYLEIVTPINLFALLERMPSCHTIATTGEKATGIISTITGTPAPPTGGCVTTRAHGTDITIWRMPSTSRAYPLSLKSKAEAYKRLFDSVGLSTLPLHD